jgi:hypothetical protein
LQAGGPAGRVEPGQSADHHDQRRSSAERLQRQGERPAPAGGVGGGDGGAEAVPARPPAPRQRYLFEQELGGDVPAGRAQRPAEADLAADIQPGERPR